MCSVSVIVEERHFILVLILLCTNPILVLLDRANCIFWTRALNIPCAHSFVFPAQLPIPPAIRGLKLSVEQTNADSNAVAPFKTDLDEESSNEKLDKDLADPELGDDSQVLSSVMDEVHQSTQNAESNGDETPSSVWVEGLVPGINFCNHGSLPKCGFKLLIVYVLFSACIYMYCSVLVLYLPTYESSKVEEDGKRGSPLVLLFVDHRAVALWEVDGPQGSLTGVPNSMYLITGTQSIFCGNIDQ